MLSRNLPDSKLVSLFPGATAHSTDLLGRLFYEWMHNESKDSQN
jgi:hypothetical protein